MKKASIKIIAAFLAVVCVAGFRAPVYAATGSDDVQTLLNGVDPAGLERLDSTRPHITQEAVKMFRNNRDLIPEDISDKALANLTLSEPIPMFVENVGAQDQKELFFTNEERKDPRFLCFCYVGGKTIGYILTTTFSTTTWGGDSDAWRYERAIEQLGGDAKGFFSVEGKFYFFNAAGEIAAVGDETLPLISLEKFRKTVWDQIQFYKNHPELSGRAGGSGVFEKLFSEPDDSPSGARRAALFVSVPLAALFLVSMSVLYARSQKKAAKR